MRMSNEDAKKLLIELWGRLETFKGVLSVEILSIADAVKKIRIYLNRDTLRPYFIISDGATDFKKFFGDFERIYISEICAGDFFIDSDLLVEKLDTLTNKRY